jgi:type II secretory pathway pseudopilin PulG
MAKKKGQVWVETVIYTMIALILIGAVLAFVKPKIQEMQDQAVVKQSIDLLKKIDSTISGVMNNGVQGTKRSIELSINRGTLRFNGAEDSIKFEMESSLVYSEPGTTITDGNVAILTENKGDENLITLNRKYDSLKYNLTVDNLDEVKSLNPSSTAYKVYISNLGTLEDKSHINIEIK